MNALAVDGITHASLTRLGWQWGDAGVIFYVNVNGNTLPVFLSLADVWRFFRQYLPLRHSIGCTSSAIGFWGAIKRAARKVSRGVKSVARKVVPKAVQQAATKVYNVARKAVTTVANAAMSDVATYALMGLALVPGMQAPAAGLLAAQQALKRVNVGVEAAKKIASGIRATPQLVRAMTQGRQAQRLVAGALQNARGGRPAPTNFLRGLQAVASGAVR